MGAPTPKTFSPRASCYCSPRRSTRGQGILRICHIGRKSKHGPKPRGSPAYLHNFQVSVYFLFHHLGTGLPQGKKCASPVGVFTATMQSILVSGPCVYMTRYTDIPYLISPCHRSVDLEWHPLAGAANFTRVGVAHRDDVIVPSALTARTRKPALGV